MKLKITCQGHAAKMTLDQVGPNLTGRIESADFGVGAVSATQKSDGSIAGKIDLDGYHADWSAKVDVEAKTVVGELKYGWFFRAPFTGVVAE